MVRSHDQYIMAGVGELLWDLLPAGKRLGGAPANFAYYAAALGDRAAIASRVGDDELGRQAMDRLTQLDLDVSCLQIDPMRPTGTAQVQLDVDGQPDFTVTESVAWDFLEWTPSWQELAGKADVVCFGSLAQRSPPSRRTIGRFLRATGSHCVRIFDVNLRQSFYSVEIISRSLSLANVVKLNDKELPRVMELLQLDGGGDEDSARRLIQMYRLDLVCVTRGARGCLLVTESEAVERSGFPVTVADAVGAGDAHTAALAHHYLRQAPLEKIAEAANRLGSWVASRVGATPRLEPEVLRQVR